MNFSIVRGDCNVKQNIRFSNNFKPGFQTLKSSNTLAVVVIYEKLVIAIFIVCLIIGQSL